MSGQGVTKGEILPEECKGKEGTLAGNEKVAYFFNKDLQKCIIDLQKQADEQATIKIQSNNLAVGGLSGAGGLACGLGLFPCLVKLISKIKG